MLTHWSYVFLAPTHRYHLRKIPMHLETRAIVVITRSGLQKKKKKPHSKLGLWWPLKLDNIGGLVQEKRNSIANALVLRLSCTHLRYNLHKIPIQLEAPATEVITRSGLQRSPPQLAMLMLLITTCSNTTSEINRDNRNNETNYRLKKAITIQLKWQANLYLILKATKSILFL